MAIIRCQVCGGSLILKENHLAECDSCGSLQSLPRIDDRVTERYNRANHHRRNKDFDRAADLFNAVLNDYPRDAATYWQLVLCKFGVLYEQDPRTGEYKPTMHRMLRTSLMTDEDYLKALEYATPEERDDYAAKAGEIYRIQQRYERISRQEKAFDVFISYKHSDDETGERTADSEIAQALYNDLSAKGLRVFFSHITLRGKSGEDYEPIIFSALESSPVMLLVTTSAEHANAVWVRNEWIRFLALTARNSDKVLIPVVRDMNPYDLPAEIGHLQAVNLRSVGARPELVARVVELVRRGKPAAPAAAAAQPQARAANDVRPLVQGMFSRIAEGQFDVAQGYADRILAQDNTHAEAYLGRLLISNRCDSVDELTGLDTPLNQHADFRDALKFADEALAGRLMNMLSRQQLRLYNKCTSELKTLRPQHANAVELLDVNAHEKLCERLFQLGNYADCAQLRAELQALVLKTQLERSRALEKDKKFEEALALLESLPPSDASDAAIQRLRERIRTRNLNADKAHRRANLLSIITCVVHWGMMVALLIGAYALYKAGDPKAALLGQVAAQLPLGVCLVITAIAGLLHGLTVENESFPVEKSNALGQLGIPVLMGVRMLLSMWVPAQGIFNESLFIGLLTGGLTGGGCYLLYNVVGMVTSLIRKQSDYEWNRLFW